jgi:hypothetical protein
MLKKRIAIAVILTIVVAGLAAGLNFVSSSANNDAFAITVTGNLEAGVEAGCMLLRADNGTEYLLLDWSNFPPVGTRIAVTGYVADDVASYCMQGSAAIHVVSISILNSTSSQSVSYGTITASTATIVTDSSVPSRSVTGGQITASGYVFEVVESPQCRPQCGAPSFILTYLYVPEGTSCTGMMNCYPPPRYYRLLGSDGSYFQATAPNGTYATVTGIVVTPSSWNCESFYAPKVCITGDIYMQNIWYGATSQSLLTTFSSTKIEREVPIPGFPLSSILTGLLLGLIIVFSRGRRSS